MRDSGTKHTTPFVRRHNCRLAATFYSDNNPTSTNHTRHKIYCAVIWLSGIIRFKPTLNSRNYRTITLEGIGYRMTAVVEVGAFIIWFGA